MLLMDAFEPSSKVCGDGGADRGEFPFCVLSCSSSRWTRSRCGETDAEGDLDLVGDRLLDLDRDLDRESRDCAGEHGPLRVSGLELPVGEGLRGPGELLRELDPAELAGLLGPCFSSLSDSAEEASLSESILVQITACKSSHSLP